MRGMKQRPFHQCQENNKEAELAGEAPQDATQSTQSFEGQKLLDVSGEQVQQQNKLMVVQPKKVSSMLSQMLQSITRVIPNPPIKHQFSHLTHNKPLHNLSSDNPVKHTEEPSNTNNMRKSQIVSVYCQKSDITFVSSSDEFSLKVFQKEEHFMHPPSLQIEVVLSRKNTCEGNNATTTSPKKSSKHQFQFQEQKINENQEDHINDDDEGYELLLSTRHDDSQLTSAISKHSSILKAFEEGSARQATKLLKSAYDLFISLQNTLMNFQK